MPAPADSAPRFHLMVLYRWKAGIGPERIRHHRDKILALRTRGVPGLLDVRFGERLCGHPESTGEWSHAAVMEFGAHADYIAFGPTPAHDEVAIELVADLERISYVGFSG